MILIKELTACYNQKNLVIDGIDLSLAQGKIHGLVGLNGAGKTTLLNVLHGLHLPASGTISYDQRPISKKDISFLPTENYFYPNITGREYLSLFPNKEFRITDWNELFHLPLDQVIDGYSTGMKKKLAILGSLKEDKPIMILDEPFNGLDLETRRVLHDILLRLKSKQKTILITSHILDALIDLCDEIHYLEAGKIKNTIPSKNFEAFKKELYDHMTKKTQQKIDTLL